MYLFDRESEAEHLGCEVWQGGIKIGAAKTEKNTSGFDPRSDQQHAIHDIRLEKCNLSSKGQNRQWYFLGLIYLTSSMLGGRGTQREIVKMWARALVSIGRNLIDSLKS